MAKVLVRDVVYVARDRDAGAYWIAGVTFREFVEALPEVPNLLMMRHGSGEALDHVWEAGMDFVDREAVKQIVREDIYGWGDFWWVDVESLEVVRRLRKNKIAELAYLSRVGKVYESPWFRKLRNRFIYMGHDDGWLLRLYARPSDLAAMLTGVLAQKAVQLRKTKAVMPMSIGRRLVKWADRGLAVNLHDSRTGISLHAVGVTTNIDGLQNRQWNMANSNAIATLQVRDGAWAVILIEDAVRAELATMAWRDGLRKK